MTEILIVLQIAMLIAIYAWMRKVFIQMRKNDKDYIIKRITADVKTKVLRDARITAKKEYSQIESYISLITEIKPRSILPSTRKWAGSPDFLKFLFTIIREEKPKTIVELGSGVSSLVCGYALEKNKAGRCYSVDHELVFANKTLSLVEEHVLSDFVEVRHAPLEKNTFNDTEYDWYQLSQFETIEHIDLLIVDGPPAATGPKARNPAVYALQNKISTDTIILLDDGIREDEKAIAHEWAELLSKNVSYYDFEKGMFKLS